MSGSYVRGKIRSNRSRQITTSYDDQKREENAEDERGDPSTGDGDADEDTLLDIPELPLTSHGDSETDVISKQEARNNASRCRTAWVFTQVVFFLIVAAIPATVMAFTGGPFYFYIIPICAAFGLAMLMTPPQFSPFYDQTKRMELWHDQKHFILAAQKADRIPYYITAAFAGISVWFCVFTVLSFTMKASDWLPYQNTDMIVAGIAFVFSIICTLSPYSRTLAFWTLMITIIVSLSLSATASSASSSTPVSGGGSGSGSGSTTTTTDTAANQRTMHNWASALAISLPFGAFFLMACFCYCAWRSVKKWAETIFQVFYFEFVAAFAVCVFPIALLIYGDRWNSDFETTNPRAYTAVLASTIVVMILRKIYETLYGRGEIDFVKSGNLLSAVMYAFCGWINPPEEH